MSSIDLASWAAVAEEVRVTLTDVMADLDPGWLGAEAGTERSLATRV